MLSHSVLQFAQAFSAAIRSGIQCCDSHLILNLARRFEIEDLTPDHTTEQTGAESNTGFISARAVQLAVQAGATCIGRTNTNEISRG